MIPNWMIVLGNNAGIYSLCLVIFPIACTALIRINDWYRKNEAREREVILSELEALVALQDHRETRRYRPSGHR